MQLSSYSVLHIESTLFKPAAYTSWSEATENAKLIYNHKFAIQQNHEKAGIRKTGIGWLWLNGTFLFVFYLSYLASFPLKKVIILIYVPVKLDIWNKKLFLFFMPLERISCKKI